MALDLPYSNSFVKRQSKITSERDNWTFSFWFNFDNNDGIIVSNGYNDGYGQGYGVGVNSSSKLFVDIAYRGSAVGSTTLSSGTWYHGVGLRDGTNSKVYLNGTQEGSTTSLQPWAIGGSAKTAIGGYPRSNNYTLAWPFDGKVAHVAFWERTLTDTEIEQLAAGFSPAFFLDSLLFYKPLNTDIYDEEVAEYIDGNSRTFADSNYWFQQNVAVTGDTPSGIFMPKSALIYPKGTISSGETTESVTKTLGYEVLSTPSAATKDLDYTVATTPAATTKDLAYDIVLTPAATTKDLAYSITSTAAAVTKTLSYTVVTTPTTTQKDLAYQITTTPSASTQDLAYSITSTAAVTKDLDYSVKTTPAAATQDLEYQVVATQAAIQKDTSYQVTTTPAAVTQDLDYEISAGTKILQDLAYQVATTPAAITKSAAYTIVTTPAATALALAYALQITTTNQKDATYTISTTTTTNKVGEYQVETSTTTQAAAEYAITQTQLLTKQNTYAVTATTALQSVLAYVILTAVTSQKDLAYTIATTPAAITKSAEYQIGVSRITASIDIGIIGNKIGVQTSTGIYEKTASTWYSRNDTKIGEKY